MNTVIGMVEEVVLRPRLLDSKSGDCWIEAVICNNPPNEPLMVNGEFDWEKRDYEDFNLIWRDITFEYSYCEESGFNYSEAGELQVMSFKVKFEDLFSALTIQERLLAENSKGNRIILGN